MPLWPGPLRGIISTSAPARSRKLLMVPGVRSLFWRWYAPAGLMLVLGFAISAWLAWHLHVRARDLDKQRLKRVAESVRDDLDTVVEKTEALLRQAQGFFGSREDRSEERRVGKECRSRWSPY